MGLDETQKKKRSEYLEGNLTITECSQKKPYVFISYASDNWEMVFKQAVVPLQKQYGLRVYADKAFDKLNDKWIVPMLRNVRGSDLMIAFVSQKYIESYACFLELLTAVNNKKQIVFVALEQELHLGDTTDQPNIERGVKNEILNQGANIATNTNNSSNDLMRAMKSAFTSISTLLEQDALSKYDISDAFINFFRDASINRKTINDLGALMGTIKSVSSNVFDKISPRNTPKQVPHTPAEVQTSQSGQSEVQAAAQMTQSGQSEAEAAVQTPQKEASEEQAVVQTSQKAQEAVQTTADYRFDEPAQKAPGKFKFDLHNKKSVTMLIGAAVGLVAVIIAVVLITSGSKHVEAMAYEYSIHNGSKAQVYTGVYTGEWKKNMPYKQGTFVYEDEDNSENGFVYEGEWENGTANGQGICIYNSGASYEGEFVDGMRSGQGTATYAEDDEYGRRDYVGQWENGSRNGQGTLTWKNGASYEGEWKDGSRSGEGTYIYEEGNEYNIRDYVGQWENDKRNGQGTMTWNDGISYEGEWKDGQYNGQGTMTYAEDDEYRRRDYVGQWENGSRNGQGTMTWNDGTSYEGEWKDNLRSGQGTYTYAEDDENGRRDYVGQWENDKANGQGTLTWKNGASYEGEWKDNLKSGQGTMRWNDGAIYQGEWKDDKCNGQGKYTSASGAVQEGIWKDNKLVE
ncbi:TIR domain-containing protein [Parablautia muri]|uniref:TIR domain-containing protein n=1 Tax=Parablautia muri TaxID=2320879 RepID=A0A9X5GT63_9FIRM|nr:TIR domain-containing protein [Parablautia muri]NBJ94718.1 TIR domain-containing protein [Parablautia muri]